MKRAWPYALALAVVVTGCYLALTPLLRSLSPAPTTSASPLSQNPSVVTVNETKIAFVAPPTASSQFVSNLTAKKKAKKKVVKKAVASTGSTTSTPSQSSNGNTGFAGNSSSSPSSSSSPGSSTPTRTTPTKTANRKGSASVGGGIDQSQADNGFAGPSGTGSVTGGQTLAPGS